MNEFLEHPQGRKHLITQIGKDASEKILSGFEKGRELSKDEETLVAEAMDELFCNEAEWVDTFYICGEEDDYPIRLETFAGIYWLNPLEGDCECYTTDKDEAVSYAFMNWENLSSEPTS